MSSIPVLPQCELRFLRWGATVFWGSRAQGPDVSVEALPYLWCSGVLLLPLSHFGAGEVMASREGKSVLLNDCGPLWMRPRLEKLSCSRRSVTSKSYDWTDLCRGRHLVCAGLFGLHMRTPLVDQTRVTSPSMSLACQSKHAWLHSSSYDNTSSLSWT